MSEEELVDGERMSATKFLALLPEKRAALVKGRKIVCDNPKCGGAMHTYRPPKKLNQPPTFVHYKILKDSEGNPICEKSRTSQERSLGREADPEKLMLGFLERDMLRKIWFFCETMAGEKKENDTSSRMDLPRFANLLSGVDASAWMRLDQKPFDVAMAMVCQSDFYYEQKDAKGNLGIYRYKWDEEHDASRKEGSFFLIKKKYSKGEKEVVPLGNEPQRVTVDEAGFERKSKIGADVANREERGVTWADTTDSHLAFIENLSRSMEESDVGGENLSLVIGWINKAANVIKQRSESSHKESPPSVTETSQKTWTGKI